jgi:hypothetical protein
MSKGASARATTRSLRQVKVQSDGLVDRLIRHGLEREAIALDLLLPLVRLEAAGTSVVVEDDRLSELSDTNLPGIHFRVLLAGLVVELDLVASVLDWGMELDLFFSLIRHVRVSPGDGRHVARRMRSIKVFIVLSIISVGKQNTASISFTVPKFFGPIKA